MLIGLGAVAAMTATWLGVFAVIIFSEKKP